MLRIQFIENTHGIWTILLCRSLYPAQRLRTVCLNAILFQVTYSQ